MLNSVHQNFCALSKVYDVSNLLVGIMSLARYRQPKPFLGISS